MQPYHARYLVAPGHGHSFAYEIPYYAFLHERHKNGTATPQAKADVGTSSGWIEIDGQFISLSLKNNTSRITTNIYCPSRYEELLGIQEQYLPDDAETPLSYGQKEAVKERALQETKKRFHDFMSRRELTVYWNAPDGQSHKVGHFGKLRHKWREDGDYSITKPWTSSIRYKNFLKALDGKNANFRLVVTVPASDLGLASHSGEYTKLSSDDSDGSDKSSVQPAPSLVAHLQWLQINRKKMGTSTGKSQEHR